MSEAALHLIALLKQRQQSVEQIQLKLFVLKGRQPKQLYTPTAHKPFHNSTQTGPPSPTARTYFGHFLIATPALSFPSNQLQSVTGMEGEKTLERHCVEISAQLRQYLVLLQHPAGNLCQTARPQHVHAGRPGGQMEAHGRIILCADKLFCYPNGLPSCFCTPVPCFCLAAHLHFDVSICLAELLSPSLLFLLPSPSLSPSVSHCISDSLTLPPLLRTCE